MSGIPTGTDDAKRWIDEMLNDEQRRWAWARETLNAIRATIDRQNGVSAGMLDAIRKIRHAGLNGIDRSKKA